jgi:hypothetical protein
VPGIVTSFLLMTAAALHARRGVPALPFEG